MPRGQQALCAVCCEGVCGRAGGRRGECAQSAPLSHSMAGCLAPAGLQRTGGPLGATVGPGTRLVRSMPVHGKQPAQMVPEPPVGKLRPPLHAPQSYSNTGVLLTEQDLSGRSLLTSGRASGHPTWPPAPTSIVQGLTFPDSWAPWELCVPMPKQTAVMEVGAGDGCRAPVPLLS